MRRCSTSFETLESRCLLAVAGNAAANDAQIVINEIMYHPSSGNPLEEFVELYNPGQTPVNLSQWQFSKGIDFTFPTVDLLPGEFLIVAADIPSFSTKYPEVANVVGPWQGRLSNQSEEIELLNASGKRMDRVTYADQGDWAVRSEGPEDQGHTGWEWTSEHDGGGASAELVNVFLSNRQGQNWQPSLVPEGTPGIINSRQSYDIAPMILDVSHFPLIPQSNEPVTVSATLVDELPSGVSATLFWRVDGFTEFQNIPMQDHGQNNDLVKGDGIYSTTIPAHPDQTVIEFFIQAADASTHSRSYPAATLPTEEQLANLLYQVNDSVVSLKPGSHPIIHLIMTEAQRAELADIGDGPGHQAESNAQMNATYIHMDGTGNSLRYHVGVRNRGNGSRISSETQRNNYRVNFCHDQPLDGITALNLNARGVADQLIGSAIQRLAGNSAADARPVKVRVNGQDLAIATAPMYGSYVALEVLGSDYLDHHAPLDSNGNLYRIKGGSPGGDLRFEGTEPDTYRNRYFKQTNEEADDWTDLIQLTDVLNNAPDESFLPDISQVIDVDQWLGYIALDSLLGNREGGLSSGRGDDFAMYRGNQDTRFQLIPHDLDTLFTPLAIGHDIFFDYVNVDGLTRLLTHPDTRPKYYQAFHNWIDSIYNPETLNPLIDSLLGDFVSSGELNAMKQFIVDRTDNVLVQLPSELLSVSSTLPIVGDFHYTTSDHTIVHGTASRPTQSVLVNGQPATMSFDGSWGGLTLTTPLISSGDSWDYLDNGTDQGSDWKDPEFETDENWNNGPAQLGYGDGDETTVVDFGPDAQNKYITTYFRHTFEIPDNPAFDFLNVQLMRDDGATIYLNGTEVIRDNLPAEADFLTFAEQTTTNENAFHSFNLDPAELLPGTNVIAAEVHQATRSSSDLSFDLELSATAFLNESPPVRLNPGLNRLVVQALDGPDGTGNLLETQTLDIWYDTGSAQAIAGSLSGDEITWTAASGPYHVTDDVTIPAGTKLVIEPGTSVYFDEGRQLLINGVLEARGTVDQRIRFSSVPNAPWVPDTPNDTTGLPDGPPRWKGIRFIDSLSSENIISYADIEYAQDNQGAIGLIRSEAVVDNVSFQGTHLRMIYSEASSLIVRNSIFPDMFAADEQADALGLDNIAEHVKATGKIPEDGHFIIQNNLFGINKGHNDVLDVDSGRVPDPIVQILDNVFLGAGDELCDLGGDVYLAGNLFMNVAKDDETSDLGYANAISAGDAGGGGTTVVARNTFWNIDHAINLKRHTATIFENNTVVKVHDDFLDRFGNPNVGSVVNFFVDEPTGVPGEGAYVAGNIFYDLPRIFGNVDLPAETTTAIQAYDNLIDPEMVDLSLGNRLETVLDLGSGNLLGNPGFLNELRGDFRLPAASPAIGNGFLNHNHGSDVPAGAWISNEPEATTSQTTARLQVGGPGIFAYRYRVNDGPWSDDLLIGNGFDPVATIRSSEIVLEGLVDGSYTVEVMGQDFAGVWQDSPTVSRTWTVKTSQPHLLINEVLANNAGAVVHDGTLPDLIELHNAGAVPIDLLGVRLTDDPSIPNKFTFPTSQILPPGEFLVLYADNLTSLPGIHLGFSLQQSGESLYLFDKLTNGGSVLDTVSFGFQAANLSLGRLGHQRSWGLALPTFGAENQAQPVASTNGLKINEWLASQEQLVTDDFIELKNTEPLPVEISGLFLTDEPAGNPFRYQFPPLSFIRSAGYLKLLADGNPANGPGHLDFQLDPSQEIVSLLDTDASPLHQIVFYDQATDVSQGRDENTRNRHTFFDRPSPGSQNPNSITTPSTLVGIGAPWSYEDSGRDFETVWKEVSFDDSSWASGPGPLGYENEPLPTDLATQLTVGATTFYFRHDFTIDTDPANIDLKLTTMIDDGLILYINGAEAFRLGMSSEETNSETLPSRIVNEAAYEGPFNLPSSLLVPGDNVIAAEVHQAVGSRDIVFGLTLDANIISAEPITVVINEVNYHPARPLPGTGISESELEFVELYNTTTAPIDLSNWRLANAVEFLLPAGTQLPAKGQLVLVGFDPLNQPTTADEFRSFYGIGSHVSLLGPYQGKLANGGDEEIELLQPIDMTDLTTGYERVDRVHYDDKSPWPVEADGDGKTLTRKTSEDHGDTASSWIPAVATPGEIKLLGDFNDDQLVNDHDIDMMFAAINSSSADLRFDLNEDSLISEMDVDYLVNTILQTTVGDLDLDGDVDTKDLTNMLISFSGAGSTGSRWATGDTNGDGDTDTADLTAGLIHFTGAYSPGLSVQASLAAAPWRPKSSDPLNEAVPIRYDSTAGDADNIATADNLATQYVLFPGATSRRPAKIAAKLPPWHLGPFGIED